MPNVKQTDRMSFRREFILLEDEVPFGLKMEPEQEEDFKALDSGKYRHALLERPRGHSKTGDIGTEAVTEMVLGRPGQRLFCAAADEDQAKLLFEDVAGKFQRHPGLRNLVRVTQKEIVVKATGSRLRVLASDAPSAYGLRPDWIAIDELAEWRRRELWHSLWTATGKRPNCRMLVISSAGWDRTSIAWEVREIAERESNWYFSPRGQFASWISRDWLEQQRRTLPAHVYARLHESRWVEAVGAFLTVEEVDRIFADCPSGNGYRVIGVDLGVARDRSVAAVLRRDAQTGLVVVEALVTWEPRSGRKVDLPEVEEELAELAKRFSAPVMLDPWQGVLLGQRLQARGVRVSEYSFSGEGRRKLFASLLDLVRTNKLRSCPHEALRRELLSLEVSETAAGWRVDHKPGRFDDHVVAIGLAIQGLPPEIVGECGVWAGGRRTAYLGPEGDLDELIPWTSRGTRGAPGRTFGDW